MSDSPVPFWKYCAGSSHSLLSSSLLLLFSFLFISNSLCCLLAFINPFLNLAFSFFNNPTVSASCSAGSGCFRFWFLMSLHSTNYFFYLLVRNIFLHGCSERRSSASPSAGRKPFDQSTLPSWEICKTSLISRWNIMITIPTLSRFRSQNRNSDDVKRIFNKNFDWKGLSKNPGNRWENRLKKNRKKN